VYQPEDGVYCERSVTGWGFVVKAEVYGLVELLRCSARTVQISVAVWLMAEEEAGCM